MTTSEFKTIWTRIVGTDNETRNPMGWSDAINALATDSEANVYAVGHVYGNIFDSTSNGSSDAVIAKFDSSGNFQWGKLFGNGTSDMASGVTCDAEGNVYIMAMHGPTWGEDMPGYMGQPFITKLDCDGNLLWQRETPATAGQTSWRLIVDTNQNVYAINCNGTSWLNAFSKDGDLLGSYSYSGYLTDISAFQDRVRVTGYWSAVTSVDFNLSNGFDASTETILSSPGDDVSSSIKFDADGNYYVAGSITAARDTPGTSYVGLNGETGIVGGVYNQDCFLVKYSPDNQLVWTRQFGTEADEYVKGIAIDQRGNVYVGGVENYIATIGIPFLKVFDPNGNLLWTKTWDSTASLGKVNTFTADNLGFIYAGGEIVGDLNGEASSGNERPDGFLFKFAYVTGTNTDDNLVGSSGADEIYALDGNDTVMAGEGDDLIIGGNGSGNDRYFGGTGADTAKYTSATAGIKVSLWMAAGLATSSNTTLKDAAGIGKDRLYDVENIIAGEYADTLIGSRFDNAINGESGNDIIYGLGGDDALIGGAGNDRLCGGSGSDNLEGGLGDDRFVLNAKLGLTNIDTISDFGDGEDKIVLSKLVFKAFRGSITAGNLVTGTTASLSAYAFDRNDFLIFDTATNVLSYDADGSGYIAAVAIANVDTVGISNLSHTDFLMG